MIILFVMGFMGILLLELFHLIIHPEWTEAQAFFQLWKFYAVSAVLIAIPIGWWRTKE